MKKAIILTVSIVAVLAVSSVIGLAVTGAKIGWGPFQNLYWKSEVKRVTQTYKATDHQNEIEFYGASNFRLWKTMEEDLFSYKIINCGFGGSTDELMMKYKDKMLYAYHPKIVFFQTGSNDYVSLSGTEEDKISKCMENKKEMFEMFHKALPEAHFVIMSGLLLPGRSQYTEMTLKINEELATLADKTDYLSFVNADDMTYDGTSYREDLFISDGIHLNHEGQLLWRDNYILPELERVIETYGLESVRK